MAPPSLSPPLETVLKDRFVLKEVIGRGGMGTVYKAVDRIAESAHDRNPYVAIKVLNADLANCKSFFFAMQREAVNTMKLAHPNIVLLRDFDRDGQYVFLCMEYLQGQSLKDVIGGLPPGGMKFEEAWPLIEGMGKALAYAHERKIIHADFKPGNVFLTEKGNVKVLDFGIARQLEADDRTRLFEIEQAHTLAYSTVEMIEGSELDSRDDIYSFSCVIYELLSGRHPFEGRLSAKQALRKGLKPQPPDGLDERQWRCLRRGLALERKYRLVSVDELLEGLGPRRLEINSWQKPLLISSLILLLGMAGVLGYWAVTHQQATRRIMESGPVLPVLPGKNIATSTGGLLTMAVESHQYKIGETLHIQYAVAKPLYLRLVYFNSSGETGVLYPDDEAPDLQLVPGRVYQYPPVDADYELYIQGPPGTDRLVAIASEHVLPVADVLIDGRGNLTSQGLALPLTVLKLSYSVVQH